MSNVINVNFKEQFLSLEEQMVIVSRKRRADRRTLSPYHSWDTDDDLIACHFAKHVRNVDEVERMADSLGIRPSAFKARISSFRKLINHGMRVGGVPDQVVIVFANFESYRRRNLAS